MSIIFTDFKRLLRYNKERLNSESHRRRFGHAEVVRLLSGGSEPDTETAETKEACTTGRPPGAYIGAFDYALDYRGSARNAFSATRYGNYNEVTTSRVVTVATSQSSNGANKGVNSQLGRQQPDTLGATTSRKCVGTYSVATRPRAPNLT